ncbi:hypothetical protein EVAR_17733_1 [Eumeta japonica]|uniref:Uncharacterized protein n=1 Tax=Eumeta variegata TaxID=151549 RepID=A0A4C1TT99_EUMVA|nr:hypothetical protein EVAR_17733_1 [Eumeta japonica]
MRTQPPHVLLVQFFGYGSVVEEQIRGSSVGRTLHINMHVAVRKRRVVSYLVLIDIQFNRNGAACAGAHRRYALRNGTFDFPLLFYLYRKTERNYMRKKESAVGRTRNSNWNKFAGDYYVYAPRVRRWTESVWRSVTSRSSCDHYSRERS